MNWKAALTRRFEDIPDDLKGHDAIPLHGLKNAQGLKEAGNDAAHSGETADVEENGYSARSEPDEQDPNVNVDNRPSTNADRIFPRVLSLICPSPSDEEEIQAYIPHYRILPILSGIIVPFSILLEIPGLTEDWYIRMNGDTIVASEPNSPLLNVGIALSILCAVLANICLIVRFLERRIRTMTISSIILLSIHDAINVAALAVFGSTRGNYSYDQAFWMTLCSTIVSFFTNVTLFIDLVGTRNFKQSGSGLTRRQRSLIVVIIGLFCYVALGALFNALLLDLTFIDGLYYTVATIETIGFGDILPESTSSRLWVCFYAGLGVVTMAFVIGCIRETVLENLDFGYRRRLLAIQERRRAARRRRRAEKRWRHAIIWRLRQLQAPVWIPEYTHDHQPLWHKLKSYIWRVKWSLVSVAGRGTHHSHGPQHGMKLNLWALPRCQLDAAALEAGVPLDTLLPADFYDTYEREACRHSVGAVHHPLPSWFAVHPVYYRGDHAPESPTDRRLGAMAALLSRLGFFIYESGGSSLPNEPGNHDFSTIGVPSYQNSSGNFQTSSEIAEDYRADVMYSEKRAYYMRSGLSLVWFLVFWMGGAAIFKVTEGWTYGLSIYFCFIAFSTIGYGDFAPTTPAGRSIFVVWALVGVATMTIMISVIAEVYTSRYKAILGRNTLKHAVQQYRRRSKVELSENVQRMYTSTSMRAVEVTDVIEDLPSPTSPVITHDDGGASAVVSTSVQQSLEQLPHKILTVTESIKRYAQLINDFDGHSVDVRLVDDDIWNLVDEVFCGRKLPENTKTHVLEDTESRQALMMLGIERSLKELVDISEQAIAAIQERDQIIARLEGEGAEQDEIEEAM